MQADIVSENVTFFRVVLVLNFSRLWAANKKRAFWYYRENTIKKRLSDFSVQECRDNCWMLFWISCIEIPNVLSIRSFIGEKIQLLGRGVVGFYPTDCRNDRFSALSRMARIEMHAKGLECVLSSLQCRSVAAQRTRAFCTKQWTPSYYTLKWIRLF